MAINPKRASSPSVERLIIKHNDFNKTLDSIAGLLLDGIIDEKDYYDLRSKALKSASDKKAELAPEAAK